MKHTKIQWADFTFNPWIGCAKVSAGCANCYAETLMAKRYGRVEWGHGAERSPTSDATWDRMLTLNRRARARLFRVCDGCGRREARRWDPTLPPGGLSCCSTPGCLALPESESAPVRPRVFCASLADWLDPEVPTQWRQDLLELVGVTRELDWLLLTKRPQEWGPLCEEALERGFLEDEWVHRWLHAEAPAHVWMGTSVETQETLEERWEILREIPARVRFLSIEPLLERVDLRALEGAVTPDWIIVGGESGPGARPCDFWWVQRVIEWGQERGVPVFVKQLGARPVVAGGRVWAVKDPKGGDPEEWPERLRVRQFPELTVPA